MTLEHLKKTARWRSDRMHKDTTLVRWGTFGTPVLLFPTAGGDAEEIERFHLVGVLAPLIEAQKIKVYSCDSVAGKAMIQQEGTPRSIGCGCSINSIEYVKHARGRAGDSNGLPITRHRRDRRGRVDRRASRGGDGLSVPGHLHPCARGIGDL